MLKTCWFQFCLKPSIHSVHLEIHLSKALFIQLCSWVSITPSKCLTRAPWQSWDFNLLITILPNRILYKIAWFCNRYLRHPGSLLESFLCGVSHILPLVHVSFPLLPKNMHLSWSLNVQMCVTCAQWWTGILYSQVSLFLRYTPDPPQP